MSEPIPESIPTSLSHPSHRANKRLRPNPTLSSTNPQLTTKSPALLAQATQISNLMSQNPDVPLPSSLFAPPTSSSSLTAKSSYQPPEIVANVQGSSAGAGSGEFHVYKASRRREYERIRGMEEEARMEQEDLEWERKEVERRQKDEKEREKKRERRRARKGGKAARNARNKGDDRSRSRDGSGGEAEREIERDVMEVVEKNTASTHARKPLSHTAPSLRHGDGKQSTKTDLQTPAGGGVVMQENHQGQGRSEEEIPAGQELGVIIHDDD